MHNSLLHPTVHPAVELLHIFLSQYQVLVPILVHKSIKKTYHISIYIMIIHCTVQVLIKKLRFQTLKLIKICLKQDEAELGHAQLKLEMELSFTPFKVSYFKSLNIFG